MGKFELYLEDLTEDAQKVLLEMAGIEDPSELNWDILPITTLEFEKQ